MRSDERKLPLIMLSYASSSQICKSLLAWLRDADSLPPAITRSRSEPLPGEAAALATTGGVPLELVARCASKALAAVRAACDDGAGGWDAGRAGLVTWLVETEALPQAGRWHRRDLAPALAAAWRAVVRALAGGKAGGRARTALAAR